MKKPMTDDDLNELVHVISDVLDSYLAEPVDRYLVNDRVSELVLAFGIPVIEDDPVDN